MLVDAILLADYAETRRDGTNHIIGGFLERFSPKELPAAHSNLAILVRGWFTAEECGSTQLLQLRVMWNGAVEVSGGLSVEFDPVDKGGNGTPFQCIFAVRDLVLPAVGVYHFVLVHNRQEVARRHLQIAPPTPALPASEEAITTPVPSAELKAAADAILQAGVRYRAAGELTRGYAAFEAGDLSAAVQAFQNVIEIDPTHGAAHNNMGFVLLGMRRPDEALGALIRARQLEYPDVAVLEANLGCAAYMRNQYDAALASFSSAFSQPHVPAPSQLWLISGDELHVLRVDSVGTFVALMSLNAAWTWHRSGRPSASWLRLAESLIDLVGDPAAALQLRDSANLLSTSSTAQTDAAH